jgi:hypothetical protein
MSSALRVVVTPASSNCERVVANLLCPAWWSEPSDDTRRPGPPPVLTGSEGRKSSGMNTSSPPLALASTSLGAVMMGAVMVG